MKKIYARAAIICNKAQYNEASLWERIQLRFYLIFFKECGEYTKKNTQLSSLCEKATLQALSASEKEEMKKNLEKKL